MLVKPPSPNTKHHQANERLRRVITWPAEECTVSIVVFPAGDLQMTRIGKNLLLRVGRARHSRGSLIEGMKRGFIEPGSSWRCRRGSSLVSPFCSPCPAWDRRSNPLHAMEASCLPWNLGAQAAIGNGGATISNRHAPQPAKRLEGTAGSMTESCLVRNQFRQHGSFSHGSLSLDRRERLVEAT